MLYTVVYLALFFAIMAGWRFVFTHAVYDYGFIGWLVLMAGLFAVAFWMDRRWPQLDPFPGISRIIKRKLETAGYVDLVYRCIFLVLLFAGIYAFPREWAAFWAIPLGLVYWRWAACQNRYEKRLLEEGDGEQGHQRGDGRPDRLVSDSRRRHRLGSDWT